jgi:hypothetical protein
MAVTRRPVGAVSQVNPGQYVDRENNLFTGTWENPEYIGAYGGPTPGEGNWVPVQTTNTQPAPPPPAGPHLIDGTTPTTRANGDGSYTTGYTGSTQPTGTQPSGQYTGGIAPRTTTPPPVAMYGGGTPTPGATPTAPLAIGSTGGGITARSASTASPDGVRDYILTQLNAGPTSPLNLEAIVNAANTKFGLPSGSGAAAYGAGSHGDPHGLIAIPGGYFAVGPDGKWGFNARNEGGGTPPPSATPSDYTWAQAINLANQHAGHSLSDAEVRDLTRMFGPGNQGADYQYPSSVTQAGLQPVLDYLDAHRTSGPGGNPPPTTPPNHPIPTGFGGPGNGGVYGDRNLQQVGQDPFSSILTNGLAGLILSGGSGFNGYGDVIRNVLADTAQNGGRFNTNTEALNLEQARGVTDRARRAEMAGIRGDLANRGLVSEPGHPQGLEMDAADRLEERVIAPMMSDAVQKYLINEGNNASDRFNTALQTGASLSSSDNNTLLNTLNAGTNRQTALSDIAIRSLEQNRLFNQFLAQYGLDVDRFLNEVSSGQNTQLMALLQQFINLTGLSTGGYIGDD